MVHLMPGDFIMADGELRGLQEQINSLGTRMEKGFDELKSIVSGFDKRVRDVELIQANSNPILTSRVDATWRKLDEHDGALKDLDKEIEDIKKTISELINTNRILKWILGVLTTLMTTYLIKLLVGG
jgi:chromosome segregation ATPase